MDDDITPNLPDDSLLRDDSSSMGSDYSAYYGFTKPEEVTSADVLMIPATILAVCFFSFVYKIIKRVLF